MAWSSFWTIETRRMPPRRVRAAPTSGCGRPFGGFHYFSVHLIRPLAANQIAKMPTHRQYPNWSLAKIAWMALVANTRLTSQVIGSAMTSAVSTLVTTSAKNTGTAGQPLRVKLSSFIRFSLSWLSEMTSALMQHSSTTPETTRQGLREANASNPFCAFEHFIRHSEPGKCGLSVVVYSESRSPVAITQAPPTDPGLRR